MSQQKAQLISPIDTFTPPGINVTGAGIVTATSFVGSGGTVTGLAAGANVTAGVVTATSFYGDGSNLDGVAAAGYVGQTTAAQSGTTTIDLSAGNVIYFTQDTDTTVAFASTEAVQELLFIRTKDDTTTTRTITWPSSIIWNGGTAPTLIDSSQAGEVQIFNLTTRDQGVTWYGYEAMKNDPDEPAAFIMLGGYGQYLANNDTVPRSSPTQIAGTWSSVFVGYSRAGGIKTDNTLWMWGPGGPGALAQNDRVSRSSPIQIPGTQWTALSGHQDCHTAIKSDGTLWTWGENQYGKLGINDVIPRSSPVQVPGTSWSYISKGFHGTQGIKTDGTLWSWGTNSGGYLGLNDTANRSSPTQVPGTQWASVSKTYYHTIATKTDGTLWGWGSGSSGKLGQNNQVPYSSPIQIPGTWSTSQDLIGCAGNASFAGKTDGTLWSWGYGSQGSLGQNDRIGRSSPKQIPGTSWSRVRGGMIFQNTVSAIKTDGTLWVWGNNGSGGFGFNDTVPRSSPTQVPGTSWSKNDTGSNVGVIRG